MAKFEDNVSPYLTFVEGAAPSSPAATKFKLYYDSSDHLLKWKNSAGTVTTIQTGTATGIATDPIWAAKGDIVGATGNDAAAVLSAGTNGYHIVYDSTQSTGLRAEKGNVLKDFAKAKRTAGNVTCNNTSWTAVDTAIDLTVDGITGDCLEVGVQAGAYGSENVTLNLTPVTVVATVQTNDMATDATVSNSTFGFAGWRIPNTTPGTASGSILYTVVAGDVSGGAVTVRLCYRTSSATNRVLTATDPAVHFWVANHGQAL